jgi:hypothetical protein
MPQGSSRKISEMPYFQIENVIWLNLAYHGMDGGVKPPLNLAGTGDRDPFQRSGTADQYAKPRTTARKPGAGYSELGPAPIGQPRPG